MTKEERALEAARTLQEFCKGDCKACPFFTEEDGIMVCCLDAPARWILPEDVRHV